MRVVYTGQVFGPFITPPTLGEVCQKLRVPEDASPMAIQCRPPPTSTRSDPRDDGAEDAVHNAISSYSEHLTPGVYRLVTRTSRKKKPGPGRQPARSAKPLSASEKIRARMEEERKSREHEAEHGGHVGSTKNGTRNGGPVGHNRGLLRARDMSSTDSLHIANTRDTTSRPEMSDDDCSGRLSTATRDGDDDGRSVSTRSLGESSTARTSLDSLRSADGQKARFANRAPKREHTHTSSERSSSEGGAMSSDPGPRRSKREQQRHSDENSDGEHARTASETSSKSEGEHPSRGLNDRSASCGRDARFASEQSLATEPAVADSSDTLNAGHKDRDLGSTNTLASGFSDEPRDSQLSRDDSTPTGSMQSLASTDSATSANATTSLNSLDSRPSEVSAASGPDKDRDLGGSMATLASTEQTGSQVTLHRESVSTDSGKSEGLDVSDSKASVDASMESLNMRPRGTERRAGDVKADTRRDPGDLKGGAEAGRSRGIESMSRALKKRSHETQESDGSDVEEPQRGIELKRERPSSEGRRVNRHERRASVSSDDASDRRTRTRERDADQSMEEVPRLPTKHYGFHGHGHRPHSPEEPNPGHENGHHSTTSTHHGHHHRHHHEHDHAHHSRRNDRHSGHHDHHHHNSHHKTEPFDPHRVPLHHPTPEDIDHELTSGIEALLHLISTLPPRLFEHNPALRTELARSLRTVDHLMPKLSEDNLSQPRRHQIQRHVLLSLQALWDAAWARQGPLARRHHFTDVMDPEHVHVAEGALSRVHLWMRCNAGEDAFDEDGNVIEANGGEGWRKRKGGVIKDHVETPTYLFRRWAYSPARVCLTRGFDVGKLGETIRRRKAAEARRRREVEVRVMREVRGDFMDGMLKGRVHGEREMHVMLREILDGRRKVEVDVSRDEELWDAIGRRIRFEFGMHDVVDFGEKEREKPTRLVQGERKRDLNVRHSRSEDIDAEYTRRRPIG
ncbi:hypothetical protein HK101_002351 [Irineochytrium annulatum]|nr:hypothetical protein HK101_002351 [Irineochytrium annulatum]